MRSTKFDLLNQIGVNSINVILSKISAKGYHYHYSTRAPKTKSPSYATVHDNETETTAAAAVAYFQALWWFFFEGTKENQTNPSQRSQLPGRNSNSGFRRHGTGMPTPKLRHYVA